MRHMLVFLLSVFWLGAATAEPVRVQTGEHAEFTRVVLIIPTGAEWQLGRRDNSYVVRLPGTDGYETSGFFDLIPQDRIAAVSQNPDAGELRLQLGCTCYAEAFLDRPGVLVIDIRDGTASPGSPFETVLDVPPDDSAARGPVPNTTYLTQREPILPLFPQKRSETVSEVVEAVQPAVVTNVPVQQPDLSVEGSVISDLATLEQSVTESLGRALSQGLLETDLGNGTSDGGPMINNLEDRPAPGLRVATSIDRAAIPDDPFVPTTQQGNTCLPGQYFDVASWGDERPYAAQIGEARAQLTGEFDGLEEEAVTMLARRYIYFGFGREAQQVLKLDAVTSQERLYLAAIANIIDGETVDTDLFAQQVSCQSEVALWAALAFSDGALDSQLDRPSVLRTFKSLPPALQSHLAPRLTERFVAIGDNDAAFQALDVVRDLSDAPLDAALAEVSLNRALGKDEVAAEQLENIVDTEVRVTPEVMISLLEQAVRNNRPIDKDDLVLADALRFENAQLTVAADLAVAQIRAYLHIAKFAAARQLMRDEAEQIGDARGAVLADEFARSATAGMPNSDFLSFAFEDDQPSISPETENTLARRLLDLGFAERAQQFLTNQASDTTAEERGYLRAEAAIALGDLDRADSLLTNWNTERADTLRQIIDDMRATDSIIARDFRSGGDARSQWQRGDWGDLVSSEDALLQAASTAFLDQDRATLDPEMSLASGRTMLEQSAQSRDVVQDLLERFAGPSDF
ncbi:hypothetical protein [Yoonia sp. SDW83-1]|uniref:hypothetical protein n=1 Tax=Yoonia sp. SDW83-1 TaxID=3366945 RepID=UPI00398C7586